MLPQIVKFGKSSTAKVWSNLKTGEGGGTTNFHPRYFWKAALLRLVKAVY